jgi:hypothetical protein
VRINTFLLDDAWQRDKRDRFLAAFYGEHAFDGRYVFVDKGALATRLQREFAVDTLLQGKQGDLVPIEEKIVRWKGRTYDAFCLETDSCTVRGHEDMGWMYYGQALWLFYCFEQADLRSLLCYLISFPELQRWFFANMDTFPMFRMKDTVNRTTGRVVSIAAVQRAVPTYRYVLFERAPPKPRKQVIGQMDLNLERWEA